jgi:hypothetical protein
MQLNRRDRAAADVALDDWLPEFVADCANDQCRVTRRVRSRAAATVEFDREHLQQVPACCATARHARAESGSVAANAYGDQVIERDRQRPGGRARSGQVSSLSPLRNPPSASISPASCAPPTARRWSAVDDMWARTRVSREARAA